MTRPTNGHDRPPTAIRDLPRRPITRVGMSRPITWSDRLLVAGLLIIFASSAAVMVVLLGGLAYLGWHLAGELVHWAGR